jgi:putative ABC transport system permease protein
MNPGDIKDAIMKTENIWKKYFPQLPFEYKFLDEDFNSQYAADQKRGKIFAAFSILTIIITCLGLLGLTAFTTQQKQKGDQHTQGVGRKHHACSSHDYQKLPVAGIDCRCYCISGCVVLYEQLVAGIPIQCGMSVIPFIVSAFVIVITSSVTVMFYSAKAAMTKPAKILSTE